jgi:hypothetical protein
MNQDGYSRIEKDFLGNERMVHYDANGSMLGFSEILREPDGSIRVLGAHPNAKPVSAEQPSPEQPSLGAELESPVAQPVRAAPLFDEAPPSPKTVEPTPGPRTTLPPSTVGTPAAFTHQTPDHRRVDPATAPEDQVPANPGPVQRVVAQPAASQPTVAPSAAQSSSPYQAPTQAAQVSQPSAANATAAQPDFWEQNAKAANMKAVFTAAAMFFGAVIVGGIVIMTQGRGANASSSQVESTASGVRSGPQMSEAQPVPQSTIDEPESAPLADPEPPRRRRRIEIAPPVEIQPDQAPDGDPGLRDPVTTDRDSTRPDTPQEKPAKRPNNPPKDPPSDPPVGDDPVDLRGDGEAQSPAGVEAPKDIR